MNYNPTMYIKCKKGENMSKYRFDKFVKERRILTSPVDLPMPGVVSPFRNCTVFLKRGGTLLGVLGAGEVNARGYVSTGSTVFISAKRLEKAIYKGEANVTVLNYQMCQTTGMQIDMGAQDSSNDGSCESGEYIHMYKGRLYRALINNRNETISFLDLGWFNNGLPVFSVHHLHYPFADTDKPDKRIEMLGTMLVSVKDREALGNIYIDMIYKHGVTLPPLVDTDAIYKQHIFIGCGYPSDDNISMKKNYADVPFFAYNKYRLSMFPRLATNIDKLLEELQMGTLKQPFLISLEPQDIFTVEKYNSIMTCENNQDMDYTKAIREMSVEYPVEYYPTMAEVMEIKEKADYFNKEIQRLYINCQN